MDRYLIQTLTDIGFEEKEARVMLASMNLGKASAGEIAKHAELKRAIVYVILERLAKQGYVTQVPTHGIRTYLTMAPEQILKMHQQQVENFRFMLPLMLRHTSSSHVEFHDTVEGALSVSYSFGQAKHARYITNYAEIKRLYGEAVIKQWAAYTHDPRQKTRVQQIVVDEPEGRAFAQMIRGSKTWQLRFLPPDIQLFPDIDIVDETVAVTNSEPFFMVVMHSKENARMFEYLFDTLWKQSLPDKRRKRNFRPA